MITSTEEEQLEERAMRMATLPDASLFDMELLEEFRLANNGGSLTKKK